MTEHLNSPFTIDSWQDEQPDEHDGVAIRRARVTKTFGGDLVGTSWAELTLAGGPVEGSAAYVGMERFTGSLRGRKGSFVLHHSAASARGEQSGSWTVVPDSGTGELTGLRGSARIDIDPDGAHTLRLDCELDEH